MKRSKRDDYVVEMPNPSHDPLYGAMELADIP